MSLFRERAASAKKVVSLQNEIITLKNALRTQKDDKPSKETEALDRSNAEALLKVDQLEDLVSSLKAENKKVRGENTRLKKKLLKERAQQAEAATAEVAPEIEG
jgi:hypothetical protein